MNFPAAALFAALLLPLDPPARSAPEPTGLIRHVVCFTFKDEATPGQIKEVEDAFRALPGKIPAILAFEWGKNIGTLERSRGHTHCFVLTFRDAASRDSYLPHPDHKAFGKLAGPLLKHVTVIDYAARDQIGRPVTDPVSVAGRLRHLVCFQFNSTTTPESVKTIEDGFVSMARAIPTVQSFEWGTNSSPEGKSDGLTHCFLESFADKAGHEVYDKHPIHDSFRALIGPKVEKLLVVDYIAQE